MRSELASESFEVRLRAVRRRRRAVLVRTWLGNALWASLAGGIVLLVSAMIGLTWRL
ncbi:MAG: hypothetical protein M3072_11355 [Candidatus Dormibacteraeota bacterium]|nr:hypothetical protein [Candidatus Dormibacteraeota bacterium]